MRRSLAVRILLLLTIALLPIGLIAVQQTASVVREAIIIGERDILARTSAAVGAEQALIRQAQGAAQALGTTALVIGEEAPECSAAMKAFVDERESFVFAGFGGVDGVMTCLSTGNPVDVSGLDDWADFVENPRQTVVLNQRGVASGESVLIATEPIYSTDGQFAGFTSVSIPLALAETLLSLKIEDVELALVNREGAVLSTSTGADDAWIFDRLEVVPGELVLGRGGQVLTLDDSEGNPANVAVVPLIPDNLYVLGKWSQAAAPVATTMFGTPALIFPIVMWGIGLVVAFFAIERLVLRHLRTLRRQMSALSMEDRSQSYALLPDAPIELVQIANSYNGMIDRISAEHEQVEQASREKTLLLKEVHHRVKNNLQLIASILNMQLRHLEAPEAQRVLRRVQDRVMSLATIHKSLYVDTNVQQVRVDRILTEIISSVLNVGLPSDVRLEPQIDLQPVELDPDQAVPLSLLVTEAVTNALKYGGTSGAEPAQIAVSLSEPEDGVIQLGVTNSRGEKPLQSGELGEGTGLGSRLIEAFVSQLGGDLRVDESPDAYALHVVFRKHVNAPVLDEAAE